MTRREKVKIALALLGTAGALLISTVDASTPDTMKWIYGYSFAIGFLGIQILEDGDHVRNGP